MSAATHRALIDFASRTDDCLVQAMSLRRLTTYSIVGLAVVGLGVGIARGLRVHADKTSMKPVDITLVDTSRGSGIRFSVPRAYLKRSYDRRGGQPTDFVVEAIYPDMSPRSLSNRGSFDGPDDERFSVHIWAFPGEPAGVTRLMEHLLDGLPRTSSDREPSFVTYKWASSRDYLVPADFFASETLFLDCIPFEAVSEAARQRIQCTVNIGFGDRLWIRYSYQRRHLDRWRDVDAKVRALLRTFVVDCFEVSGFSGSDRVDRAHSCPF